MHHNYGADGKFAVFYSTFCSYINLMATKTNFASYNDEKRSLGRKNFISLYNFPDKGGIMPYILYY